MRHALIPLLTALACAHEPESADLTLSIYGEAFIEEGIPADVFVDGWSVTFGRFLISVGEVEAGGEPLDPADTRYRIYDLVKGGGGLEVGRATPDLAALHDLSFVIGPSDGAVGHNVEAEAVTMMRAMGYSLYVSGVATKGGASLSFAWGFTARTAHARCDAGAPTSGQVDAEITIHGDHLFHDDLASETPNVAFDLIASADQNGDGSVREDELRAVDIRAQERYQVGDRTDITDLWSFIAQQATTVGHFNGEAHCGAP